jgi:hypothetical protein
MANKKADERPLSGGALPHRGRSLMWGCAGGAVNKGVLGQLMTSVKPLSLNSLYASPSRDVNPRPTRFARPKHLRHDLAARRLI